MKKIRFLFVITVCILMGGCLHADTELQKEEKQKNSTLDMEAAVTTPYGRYPELVTYTLGKMTGSNHSNMPSGDTYEDNAYTRYLKDMLNVQNENAFEAYEDYDDVVAMAIERKEIPDIMVVSTIDQVQRLAEEDLIEDLTDAYHNCASTRIKAIYSSYGDSLFGNVTFDGKMMAIPETNIEDGYNDAMDEKGLA